MFEACVKAQEVVRRLDSINQQLSADSNDLADRLAAVTADRDTKLTASKHMINTQKDKVTRISKERDF